MPVLIRYAIGVAVGAVITVALLYLMQAVISSDKNPLNEAPKIRIIDFAQILEDMDVTRKDLKPKPPPPPDEVPPELPKPDFDFSGDSTGLEITGEAPDINIDMDTRFAGGDGEYLPIAKVQPIYPKRALSRGIEGWVIVEFVVTVTGAVRDVFVVEAEPPGIFDRAAIQAAEKFKYKPRMVNEKPVEVAGVQNIIRFNLEDE